MSGRRDGLRKQITEAKKVPSELRKEKRKGTGPWGEEKGLGGCAPGRESALGPLSSGILRVRIPIEYSSAVPVPPSVQDGGLCGWVGSRAGVITQTDVCHGITCLVLLLLWAWS